MIRHRGDFAFQLGISDSTLLGWWKRHPEFHEAITLPSPQPRGLTGYYCRFISDDTISEFRKLRRANVRAGIAEPDASHCGR